MGTAIGAKDRLARAARFVSKYLKGYSREAVDRAVRFGLIPAQGEARRVSLEEDYRRGPPFVFQDNRIRHGIEVDFLGAQPPPEGGFRDPIEKAPQGVEVDSEVGDQSSVQPVVPPVRQVAENIPPPRAPASGSVLSQSSPVAPRPTGQASQETLTGLSQLGMPFMTPQPVYAAHGGYISGGSRSNSGPMEESGIFSITRKPRQLVG